MCTVRSTSANQFHNHSSRPDRILHAGTAHPDFGPVQSIRISGRPQTTMSTMETLQQPIFRIKEITIAIPLRFRPIIISALALHCFT